MSIEKSPLQQTTIDRSPLASSFARIAEDQNAAAERFIADLSASGRQQYRENEARYNDLLSSQNKGQMNLEEATISRYLLKSPGTDLKSSIGNDLKSSQRQDFRDSGYQLHSLGYGMRQNTTSQGAGEHGMDQQNVGARTTQSLQVIQEDQDSILNVYGEKNKRDGSTLEVNNQMRNLNQFTNQMSSQSQSKQDPGLASAVFGEGAMMSPPQISGAGIIVQDRLASERQSQGKNSSIQDRLSQIRQELNGSMRSSRLPPSANNDKILFSQIKDQLNESQRVLSKSRSRSRSRTHIDDLPSPNLQSTMPRAGTNVHSTIPLQRDANGAQIVDDFTSYNNPNRKSSNNLDMSAGMISQEVSLSNNMGMVSSKNTIHEAAMVNQESQENLRCQMYQVPQEHDRQSDRQGVSPSPLRMKQRNSSVGNIFQENFNHFQDFSEANQDIRNSYISQPDRPSAQSRSSNQGRSSTRKRLARSSSLRNRGPNQLESMDNSFRPIQLKQVQFDRAIADEDECDLDNLQNLNPNSALKRPKLDTLSPQQALTLDAFYQDLIKQERKQFERILKSKTNVARSDALQKMRKQVDQANKKFQKVNDLEKNLQFAKNNNDRLRVEWEFMKNKVKQTQEQLDSKDNDCNTLKQKLDSLWTKYEEEKDIVMQVTKMEVEKLKEQEINSIKQKLEYAEQMNKELLGRLSYMETIQNEHSEAVNTHVKMKADNDILESKLERLLIANKQIQEEQERRQGADVQELEDKHERLKKKYRQLMGQSNEMKRIMGFAAKEEGGVNGKSAEYISNVHFQRDDDSRRGVETERKQEAFKDGELKLEVGDQAKSYKAAQYGSALTNHAKMPLDDKHQKTPASANTFTVSASQEENVEIWKLRCQLLAEKYFKTLKDIKDDNLKLKQDCIKQIKDTRKEMDNKMVKYLRDYLKKMEEEDRILKRELKEKEQRQEQEKQEQMEAAKAEEERQSTQKQMSQQIYQEFIYEPERNQLSHEKNILALEVADLEKLHGKNTPGFSSKVSGDLLGIPSAQLLSQSDQIRSQRIDKQSNNQISSRPGFSRHSSNNVFASNQANQSSQRPPAPPGIGSTLQHLTMGQNTNSQQSMLQQQPQRLSFKDQDSGSQMMSNYGRNYLQKQQSTERISHSNLGSGAMKSFTYEDHRSQNSIRGYSQSHYANQLKNMVPSTIGTASAQVLSPSDAQESSDTGAEARQNLHQPSSGIGGDDGTSLERSKSSDRSRVNEQQIIYINGQRHAIVPLRNRTPSRSKSPHGSTYSANQQAGVFSYNKQESQQNYPAQPQPQPHPTSVSQSLRTHQPSRHYATTQSHGHNAQQYSGAQQQQIYKSPHTYKQNFSNPSLHTSDKYRDGLNISNMKSSEQRHYEPSPSAGSRYVHRDQRQEGSKDYLGDLGIINEAAASANDQTFDQNNGSAGQYQSQSEQKANPGILKTASSKNLPRKSQRSKSNMSRRSHSQGSISSKKRVQNGSKLADSKYKRAAAPHHVRTKTSNQDSADHVSRKSSSPYLDLKIHGVGHSQSRQKLSQKSRSDSRKRYEEPDFVDDDGSQGQANTFEQLDDEIQRSIAALKKMSEQHQTVESMNRSEKQLSESLRNQTIKSGKFGGSSLHKTISSKKSSTQRKKSAGKSTSKSKKK